MIRSARFVAAACLFVSAPIGAAAKSASDCAKYVSPGFTEEAARDVLARCMAEPADPPATRPPAGAPNNAATLKLTKASRDLFEQELPPGVVGRVVTVSARGIASLLGHYESAEEAFVFGSEGAARHSSFRYMARCRSTGAFQGQNAYGARATVSRTSCEGAEVRSLDGDVPLQGKAHLHPALFRHYRDVDFPLEVDLQVSPDRTRQVAALEEWTDTATVQNPNQVANMLWVLHGHVLQVRLVLPKEPPVVLYDRK